MGVILGGCFGQFNSEGANDWLIVPGERAGLIQKHTSERLLVEIFGPENVRREIIPQADGQELAGTVVFPADRSVVSKFFGGIRRPDRLLLRFMCSERRHTGV